MGPTTRYTLRRNTASIIKICLFVFYCLTFDLIFSGDDLLFDYNAKVIQDVLDDLLPSRCLLFYSDHDQQSSNQTKSQV